MTQCKTDRTGERWTAAEDAQLISAAFTRMKWKAIAGRLGRSKSSIESRVTTLRRNGVDLPLKSRSRERRKEWTDRERDRVTSGLESGETIAQIATAIGRTPSSVRAEVWRQVGRRCYKRHHANAVRKFAAEAIELSKAGATLPDLAERYGVGVEAVRRWCLKYGHNPGRGTRRPFSLADDDRIRAGYAASERAEDIAVAMQRTAASVRMRAKKLGVTKVRRGLYRFWTTTERARAVELRKAGRTYEEIATGIGRSCGSVKSALERRP